MVRPEIERDDLFQVAEIERRAAERRRRPGAAVEDPRPGLNAQPGVAGRGQHEVAVLVEEDEPYAGGRR